MEPSAYYYGPFRSHWAGFWRSLQDKGSVSRVRTRLTPNAFDHQAARHFSVVDLVARPQQRLPDHLERVPAPDVIDFLCAVAYTVLIDQVMYTHRRMDYTSFDALTQYPKMDRTVGYSRTMMMATPLEALGDDVLSSRGLTLAQGQTRFVEWAPFIAADLRKFFTEHRVGFTTWPDVRTDMLHDSGVTSGPAGRALAAVLVDDAARAGSAR